MVHRAGFEPATPSVGGLCSILLSYRCIAIYSTIFFLFLQYLLAKNIENSKKSLDLIRHPPPSFQNRATSQFAKNRKKFQLFSKKLLTKRRSCGIIIGVEDIGASPSGKATDSDSVITGVRIPVPQPKKDKSLYAACLFFV